MLRNHAQATYTSKISSQTAHIDWNRPADEIRNLIYAMSPFPGAWFADGDERIKVFRAAAESYPGNQPAGTVLNQSPTEGIRVVCGNNSALKLLELQRAGKGRLCCADFLRGCQLKSEILVSGTDEISSDA